MGIQVKVNGFEIGSEQVTFSKWADPEIAGTTAARWFVRNPGETRNLVCGLPDEASAVAEANRLYAGNQPVTITLTDGTTVAVPAANADRFRGLDAHGNWVLADPDLSDPDAEYLIPLTPCCQATGKGSDSPTGIVCRACYRTVDGYFGTDAIVSVPRA